MKRLVSYKFRLYPNKTQEILLKKTMGCVRFFYQIATLKSYDKETNPKPNFKTSTELRKEFEWMQEVSAAAIQQKEIDFNNFKKQLFSKTRKTKIGFPKFRKKGGYVNINLKLSDRVWGCESCGAINYRDLLVANNILKKGYRTSGDITDAEAEVAKPVKRLELNCH